MQEKKGQAASFTQQPSDLSAGNRAPAIREWPFPSKMWRVKSKEAQPGIEFKFSEKPVAEGKDKKLQFWVCHVCG